MGLGGLAEWVADAYAADAYAGAAAVDPPVQLRKTVFSEAALAEHRSDGLPWGRTGGAAACVAP